MWQKQISIGKIVVIGQNTQIMGNEKPDIRDFDNHFGCGVKNVGFDEEGMPQVAVTWVTADVPDYALSGLLSFMMMESKEFASIMYKAIELAEDAVEGEIESKMRGELGVTFQNDEDEQE